LIVDPILRAIEITTEAIRARSHAHWIIAFSGGKDSSAALKVFLAAYRRAATKISKVTIIYCDTGVENPVLDSYVKKFLQTVDDEFLQAGHPFKTKLLKAPIQDRFFVRIIGRGYSKRQISG
jgi:DNA sulfur modification protein DndC